MGPACTVRHHYLAEMGVAVMAAGVLLLSADFGSGHLQAARAIAEACCEQLPALGAEVINVESQLLHLLSVGYLQLLDKAPGAYRRLYNARVSWPTRTFIHSMVHGAVARELRQNDPRVVVATHPFPGRVAGRMRTAGHLRCPVAVAITDFQPHPFWVHEGIDRYFVSSGESALKLQSMGVPADRIRVTGIPIQADFAARRVQAAQAKVPGRRNVLVMGGGLGLGPIPDAVRSLTRLPREGVKVTVVCGRNEQLKADLETLVGNDPRFNILGYTDRVPELMAEADLLVTKPGGITCSEALAVGLPMLLMQPLPGHEEENAAFLTGTGAAKVVETPLIGAVAHDLLFDSDRRLALMRHAARLAGFPSAARMVAAEIGALVSEPWWRVVTA